MVRPSDHKSPAVFLDRDGVINEVVFHKNLGLLETPFTTRQFRLKKGVAEAIQALNRLGLKTVVVSNQPGVAMRHFSKKKLSAITQKMIQKLRQGSASLDAVYYCLHHPEKGIGKLKKKCRCRKPAPGLLLKAARHLNLNLRKSYMIGDSIFDVQAGRRAGCITFLIAHLKCDLCNLMARRKIRPHYLVRDLRAAVTQIRKLTLIR